MAKFNIISATVVGGILLLLTALLVMAHRDKGNMVYTWTVVMGMAGFVTGGFIGGSFEKFEHRGIPKKVEDEEDEEDEEVPACCGC